MSFIFQDAGVDKNGKGTDQDPVMFVVNQINSSGGNATAEFQNL